MDDKLYIENETDEGKKYSESVEIPYYVKNFDEFIGKTSTKALFIAENSILLELKKELEEKRKKIRESKKNKENEEMVEKIEALG